MTHFGLSVSILTMYMKGHVLGSYFVLFFGSFFETLIGTGFFIYGELFFLAGSALAGAHVLNIFWVSTALIWGGIAGDSFSYALGRRYGPGIFKEKNKFLNLKNRDKAQDFFDRHGKKGIFLARFLGPVSWIMPFLAGVSRVGYPTFLAYNIPGVILGIGRFIIVGYFLGDAAYPVYAFFTQYILGVAFVALFLFLVLFLLRENIRGMRPAVREFWKNSRRRGLYILFKHTLFCIMIFLILYFAFLYGIFFIESSQVPEAESPTYASQNFENVAGMIAATTSIAYAGPGGSGQSEPVNFILIAKGDVGSTLAKSGWMTDVIFSRGNVGLYDFYVLWRDHRPPVSDRFIGSRPQDLAFQEHATSSLRRLHIRLWKIGTLDGPYAEAYLGAASYDTGLNIFLYNNFVVPLHQISPDVDSAREALLSTFSPDALQEPPTLMPLGIPVERNALNEDQPYFTDGQVLVLKLR